MNAQKELDVLKELEEHCKVTKDRFGQEGAYILEFNYGEAITTVRIILGGSTCKDVVITNMTTLPERNRKSKYGSRALQSFLEWSKRNKMNCIQAVQVQAEAEGFWKKNSFVPMGNETNDYVYTKS